MKRAIFSVCVLFIIFHPNITFGETVVTDNIFEDTTWDSAGSPYVLNDQFRVMSPATLTIDKGVEVRFADNAGLLINSGSKLVVSGEKGAEVIFTSNNDSPVSGSYWINNNGDVDLKYLKVFYAEDGFNIMAASGSSLIDHSDFENNINGLHIWNGSKVTITNSIFKNNEYGIYYDKQVAQAKNYIKRFLAQFFTKAYADDFDINVSNSSFLANTSSNLYLNTTWGDLGLVQATNNYWGSAGGPGSTVSDGVVFNPWLTTDPNAEFAECCSNVMFLPGVEASRLYRTESLGGSMVENLLWEPQINKDVEKLFMDPLGASLNTDIYTRDVLDEAYVSKLGPNIYKSFLNTLSYLKTSSKIADYSAIAYDWRYSPFDLIKRGMKTGDNISYINETNDPYMMSELSRLADSSQTGKVTLVAHSNGGLVAKALLQKLKDTNNPLLDKIDKVVFVAVPHLGTPTAIPALENGYKQDIWIFLDSFTARRLGQNMPDAYDLLPSTNYFTYVDKPVVKFDASLSDWSEHYGGDIHSKDLLHSFLVGNYGKVGSDNKDINNPIDLNDTLLTKAENDHDTLDNWTPPAGVEVVDIAGWGVPSTVSGVTYSKDKEKVKMNPIFTLDGDGTVVTPSALWTNGNASTSRYWVNEDQYNKDNRFAVGLFPKDHKSILDITELDDFIKNNFILDTGDALPNYISTSVPTSQDSTKRLIYSLHSPLTLNMYDDAGNHTGVSTTTGFIEDQIPGTYFVQFGDTKYIFTETNTPIHLVMQGYEPGTFTFIIEEMMGDNTVSKATFRDIPTNQFTKVSMDVSGDINTLSTLNIDADANGLYETKLQPILNGEVTFTTPTKPISGHSGLSNGELFSTTTPIISTTTPLISTTTVAKKLVKDKTQIAKVKKVNTQTANASDASPVVTSWFGRMVGWVLSLFKK